MLCSATQTPFRTEIFLPQMAGNFGLLWDFLQPKENPMKGAACTQRLGGKGLSHQPKPGNLKGHPILRAGPAQGGFVDCATARLSSQPRLLPSLLPINTNPKTLPTPPPSSINICTRSSGSELASCGIHLVTASHHIPCSKPFAQPLLLTLFSCPDTKLGKINIHDPVVHYFMTTALAGVIIQFPSFLPKCFSSSACPPARHIPERLPLTQWL